MAWGDIRPDRWQRIPVALNPGHYILKEHDLTVPGKRIGSLQGVTITELPILCWNDNCQLYIQNSIADGLTGLIPHYYVDFHGVWQILDTADCWQRKNGQVNEKTICIALIASDAIGVPYMYNIAPFNATARLTAFILHKYKLTINNITLTKDCQYIMSQWKDFRKLTKERMAKL